MLRINPEEGELVPVRQVLTEPLGARYDLRRLALSNVDAVFGEFGQRIFVLGRDLRLGRDSNGPRVDILGLDPAGNLLLTFVQPRIEPDDLSNAVKAANAAAPWSAEDFLTRLSPPRRAQLEAFLDAEPAQINRGQRIVLLSEDYDFDALLGVRMLRDRRGMDVLAIHAALAIDNQTGQEYMSCSEMSGAALPAATGLPAAGAQADGLALPPPDGADGSSQPPRSRAGSAQSRSGQSRPAQSRTAAAKTAVAAETRLATQSDKPLALKPFSDLFLDGWKLVGSELDPQPESASRSEEK